VRYVKSNSRTQEENPEEYLSIHPDSSLVLLSGKELDLNVPAEAVATDVHAWLEYFSGYGSSRASTISSRGTTSWSGAGSTQVRSYATCATQRSPGEKTSGTTHRHFDAGE
jgi:hypothetical protein